MKGDYQKQLMAEIISPSSQVDADIAAPLAIYQRNYLENGIRALAITFSTVHKLLGEENFRQLAKAYLQQYPKTQFDWGEYGQHFAGFIGTIEALEHFPFLSEVAEFDWLIHHVQRAPDKDVDLSTLSLLDTHAPQELVFENAPGLCCASFFFPVIELHALHHEQHSATEKQQLLKKIDAAIQDAINSEQLRSIVIWRPVLKATYEYVPAAHNLVIQGLVKQEPLESLIQCMGDQDSINQYFADWIGQHKVFAVRSLTR